MAAYSIIQGEPPLFFHFTSQISEIRHLVVVRNALFLLIKLLINCFDYFERMIVEGVRLEVRDHELVSADFGKLHE